MLKLYEMNDELMTIDRMMDEWSLEHEGDITDFPLNEELEKLSTDRKEKLINIAVYIKNLKANADAYAEEKKRLASKESALKNKAMRLTEYLNWSMESGEKIEDVKASIGWRKSKKVIVECLLDTLPEEFIKEEKTARLSDLKRAIESGMEFDGVRIEECQNIQIK